MLIKHQKFGEILKEEGEVFSEGKFSGILGLAFPSMSAHGVVPVFDNIIDQKLLNKNLIAFYYSLGDQEEGEITIGHVNPSKFIGEIDYYPVIDLFYWTIKLDDIKLGNKSLGICEQGCKAVVDTGTSLITGPTKHIKYLLDSIIIGNNCENYEKGEPLIFVFNGKEYDIQVKDYILKRETPFNKLCRAMIMPLDVPSPQ
jgi:cathepsin D